MSLGNTYSLQVPAGSPLGALLREATAAAREERYEEAAQLQKSALELGGSQLLPVASVVLRLTLGSYQLHLAMATPARAREAAGTLESVITRARALGMDWETVQASLGLATARCLLGDNDAAANAYLAAAGIAKQTGEIELAGEALRRAGDAYLNAGNRALAVTRWRSALELLSGVEIASDELDDVAVVTKLRAFYEERGIDVAARHLDKVLDKLRLCRGRN
ncbi:MAG TPA: hypothetical protein VGG33_06820 [Polyangia bacterium]